MEVVSAVIAGNTTFPLRCSGWPLPLLDVLDKRDQVLSPCLVLRVLCWMEEQNMLGNWRVGVAMLKLHNLTARSHAVQAPSKPFPELPSLSLHLSPRPAPFSSPRAKERRHYSAALFWGPRKLGRCMLHAVKSTTE